MKRKKKMFLKYSLSDLYSFAPSAAFTDHVIKVSNINIVIV